MAKFNMGKLNKYLAGKGFKGKVSSSSGELLNFNYKTYVDRLTELEEAIVEYAKANGYSKARRCFNGVALAKNEIILLTVMERVNIISIMYADLMANAKKSKQSVMQPVELSTFSKQGKKKASDWAEAGKEDNIDYTARRKHTKKKASEKTSFAEHKDMDSSNKSLTDSDYYKLISQDTTHDEVKKFINDLTKNDLQKLFKKANEDASKYHNLNFMIMIMREQLEDIILSGSQSVLELDDIVDTMSSEQANTREATAKNILQKIGGYKKLTKLLGANNLIPHSDGISFKIDSEVANYVKITLNAKANNYDIVYRKIKNKIIEDVALTKGLKITQILDDIKKVDLRYS